MGKPVRRLRQIPLYAHLSILFAGLMVLFAVVSGYYQYHFTSRLMMDDAQRQFAQIGAVTAAKVQGLYRPAGSLAEQLAQQQLMVAGSLPARLENLPFLVAGLQGLPAVSSIYVGYDNGDFFLVRRWQDSGELRQRLQPPPGTAWVVQSVSHRGGAARGEYLFFNLHLVELGRRVDPLYRFDPRERPWYGSAQRQNQLIVSQPYLFYTSRKAGVTFSRRAPSGMAVAGVDIELDDLSRLLLQSRVTPDTRMALLNGNGEVLASHKGAPGLIHGKDDGRLPLLAELDATVLQQLHREVQRSGKHNVLLRNAAGEWQGVVTEVPVEGGPLMLLMLAAPHRELLAEAVRLRNHSLLISGVMLLLGVLLAIWLSHFAARSLRRLMKETAKIERFQFDEPVAVNTRIREVAELAGALGEMKATVHRFLGMSMALASETQFSRLLAQLLRTMLDASGAQGGVVYLADESARHLQPVQAEWQGTALEEAGGIGGIELSAAAGHPVALALLHDSRVLSEPLEQLKTDFPGLIDGQNPLTLLVLPLRNRERALLGALVLLVDETEQALSPELLAFCEALSGTAAVALNAQRLLDEQKTLLESIIQLLAGAIDAKSPYTGGHCQRVPELTRMLAQAACDAAEGPFAGYRLSDERWEALHIAAWLHDCGKITTPEYVVDKATKLETLYDRIHEVRMRFEVLKRDAEVAYWRQLAHGGDPAAAQAELARQLATLDEEFTFVAACNQGSESMPPEHVDRIRAIARRTWRRTLDDRIGLAHEELARKPATAPNLPVEEPLLADKAEHVFARGPRDRVAPDNPWGFRMTVPEHLYNRGEIYNLCVGYGTLTEEERYKINEHIIQTIMMLERLPFPRHLKDVPEIAGGHHEKIDGSGYPKQLRGEQMSVEARMIAIADIFEALTAVDRPYKRGKTLSESLRIMQRMMWRQHIDPELFALFLRAGVYLDYARRYLQPEQIDAVDIEALLR